MVPVLTWRSEPAKSTKCKWPARTRCFPSLVVVKLKSHIYKVTKLRSKICYWVFLLFFSLYSITKSPIKTYFFFQKFKHCAWTSIHCFNGHRKNRMRPRRVGIHFRRCRLAIFVPTSHNTFHVFDWVNGEFFFVFYIDTNIGTFFYFKSTGLVGS